MLNSQWIGTLNGAFLLLLCTRSPSHTALFIQHFHSLSNIYTHTHTAVDQHKGNLGFQHLAQGCFNIQTTGSGDWIPDLPISRRSTLPPTATPAAACGCLPQQQMCMPTSKISPLNEVIISLSLSLKAKKSLHLLLIYAAGWWQIIYPLPFIGHITEKWRQVECLKENLIYKNVFSADI